ncbi:serine hydrolase domain-containing protein [Olivibacter domesticus]|nr:serine hydrolase domain-containing protein [Olivibacter domesticus]
MTGYYKHEQLNDMYIQILVEGNQLKLIQQWDFKEILFNQQSSFEFINTEENFPLIFSKNKTGEIDQFSAFGRDLWIRDHNYKPENPRNLSPSEAKALQALMDSKAEKLIKLINSHSNDSIKAFLKEHCSVSFQQYHSDYFRNRIHMAYRFTGELNICKNTRFIHKAALADYQAKGKIFNNAFEFNIKLDKDNKIKLFNSRVIANKYQTKKIKTEKDLIEDVQHILTTLQQKDLFSGTILVARGDSVLLQYVCGDAVKESHKKNDLDTRINLGSMNKMFTALAIMQLAEKNKLKVADTVSKYLDTSWLSKELADKITIHHLLTHTSGLGDFFNRDFDDTSDDTFTTLDGYRPFIKTSSLSFNPGSNWQYSNTGMILLGAIIEKVSGMNYFDYVKKHIYTLAGMTATDVYNIDDSPQNVALGYTFQTDDSYKSNLHSSYTRGSSAGGAYSTIGDLHRFAIALTSNKLVSDSSLTKMFTYYAGKQYGYGFQLWSSSNNLIVGHSGGAPGISAVEYIFPKSGYTIVVLSNYDVGSYYLGEYILNSVKILLSTKI